MDDPEYQRETADIETSSDRYARRFQGRVGRWMLAVQEQATLRMLAPYPNATILEVGGGHAQLTGALVRNGFRVTVLGSSPDCGYRLQRWIASGCVRFDVGDILHTPYPDRSFDVVISYRLLAHVKRWQDFLKELARVAAKAVILDFPEVRSINRLSPGFFVLKKQWESDARPYTCYSTADLLQFFEGLGFDRGDRFPQFLLPMMLHRKLKMPLVSRGVEAVFRLAGLTALFGSPVILKVERRDTAS